MNVTIPKLKFIKDYKNRWIADIKPYNHTFNSYYQYEINPVCGKRSKYRVELIEIWPYGSEPTIISSCVSSLKEAKEHAQIFHNERILQYLDLL